MSIQNTVKSVKHYGGEGFGCFAYYNNNKHEEKLWAVKQSFQEVMVFYDVIASDGVVWSRKNGFFTHGHFRDAIQNLVHNHLMYNVIHKPFGNFQASDYIKAPKIFMDEILKDLDSDKGLMTERMYVEGMTRELLAKGVVAENNMGYLVKLIKTIGEKLEKVIFTDSDLEAAKLLVLDDHSSPQNFTNLFELWSRPQTNVEFIYFSIKFLKVLQSFHSKNVLKGFQKTSQADFKLSETKAEFLQRSVEIALRDFEAIYFSLEAFYKKQPEWNMKALAEESLEIKKTAENAAFGIS